MAQADLAHKSPRTLDRLILVIFRQARSSDFLTSFEADEGTAQPMFEK